MNKIIVTLTLICSVFILQAQVGVAINFGSVEIDDLCRGDGICRSVSVKSPDYTQYRWDCEGTLFLDAHNHLILEVKKNMTTLKAREMQFRDGFIEILEPWELSSEITDQLDPTLRYNKISTGYYAVMEFKNSYIINFGNF